MNQILLTSNSNKKSNKTDTQKIIRIFCVALIIIAIGILSLSAYSMLKRREQRSNFALPQIEITQTNSVHVIIKAYCKDGINHIFYSWNGENQNSTYLNGEVSFEREVSIPYQKENTLTGQVVSINNMQGKATKTFNMEVDEVKPVIDDIKVQGAKLSIEASDNAGIDYIEYQWEGEEANRIDADRENNQSVKAQINIQRGTYKLTIRVADVNGNMTESSKLVTGVNEPEIQVLKYNNVISIKATHDMGIKQISVLINDKLYSYEESDPTFTKENTKEVEYPLEEGENTVKIIVYCYETLSDSEDESLDNYAYKTFVGHCTYEAE